MAEGRPADLGFESVREADADEQLAGFDDVAAAVGRLVERPVGDAELDVETALVDRAGRRPEPRPIRAEVAQCLGLNRGSGEAESE
jgi:hypothetical protein